jgi:hypothetical protein
LAAGTEEGMTNAENVYKQGGHSKSYARITLVNPLANAALAGSEVVGQSVGGDDVQGTVMNEAEAGDTEIEVQYATTAIQDNYVTCQVGGLPEPNMEGCKYCWLLSSIQMTSSCVMCHI